MKKWEKRHPKNHFVLARGKMHCSIFISILMIFLFGCNSQTSHLDVVDGAEESTDENTSLEFYEEYDASTAIIQNVEVETEINGYSGEGYLGGWNADDSFVTFEVEAPYDGEYTLVFRYASGAGSAKRQLLINEAPFLDEVGFSGSGDWGNWQTVPVYSVDLNEGENTISLLYDSASGSENWLNIDSLLITNQRKMIDEEFGDFTEYSEKAQQSLRNHFWSESTNRFINQYPQDTLDNQFHYWWLAHAVDVLVDGYERTGDEEYIDRANDLYEGILNRNGGRIPNDFYDDMIWMALALLRLYEHSDNTHHEEAVFTLWEDIKTGWNDEQGGGIAWQKHQLDYKNTPSNAPAVILATRLYQKYDHEEDLEWAYTIYDWQTENLVDPENGFIWDGINREGNGEIDYDWDFTYNQGVYIGASIELYKVTEKEEYLQAARQTAETSREHFSNHNDILYEGDSGDGGLFKGIYVRYLGELVEVDDTQEDLREWIHYNADYVWNVVSNKKEDIFFGASWESIQETPIELSQQLSGIKLLEQAAKLSR